jgi:hypothetical protein
MRRNTHTLREARLLFFSHMEQGPDRQGAEKPKTKEELAELKLRMDRTDILKQLDALIDGVPVDKKLMLRMLFVADTNGRNKAYKFDWRMRAVQLLPELADELKMTDGQLDGKEKMTAAQVNRLRNLKPEEIDMLYYDAKSQFLDSAPEYTLKDMAKSLPEWKKLFTMKDS